MNSRTNRDHAIIADFDRTILFTYFILCSIGLLVLLDICSVRDSLGYFFKQLLYMGPALMLLFSALFFLDLNQLRKYNFLFIIITIFLLILVLIFGPEVNGAKRFIKLGPLMFQPSFFARIALILYCAGVFSSKEKEIQQGDVVQLVKDFLPLIVVVGGVFLLILIEKHLSTLIVSGLTLLGMLWVAGIRKRFLAFMLVVCIIAVMLVINRGDKYRGDRIEIFKKYSLFIKQKEVNVEPAKEYQIRESMTALSSGKLFGTGINRGRAKHFFLPESRTDYVFTIIGEELGFLGAFLIFGLQCFLFWRSFRVAYQQQNQYLMYVGIGLALNLFLNVLVNVGVAMSALPSTGITLPFISYGGTSLLMDSITVGLILNISARRREL